MCTGDLGFQVRNKTIVDNITKTLKIASSPSIYVCLGRQGDMVNEAQFSPIPNLVISFLCYYQEHKTRNILNKATKRQTELCWNNYVL